MQGLPAYLGNHVWVVRVNPRVVKADGRSLDGTSVQLQRAEIEGHSWVGFCILQRVQPCPV